MLKLFNLGYVIRNHGVSVVGLAKCYYATNKGSKQSKDTTIKDDAPPEPLQLSYNSYEDLSCDSTTPPVIIMHGKLMLSITVYSHAMSLVH